MDWQWVADGAFTVVGILLTVLITSARDSIKELLKLEKHLRLKDKKL
jgi:hypothetical protein